MRVTISVLLILGLSVVLVFVVINSSQTVPVNLFFLNPISQEYPVSLVVLGSLIVGVLFASVIGIVEGTRLRLQNHQLRGKIKHLEAEIQSLRTLPAGAQLPEETLDEESVL